MKYIEVIKQFIIDNNKEIINTIIITALLSAIGYVYKLVKRKAREKLEKETDLIRVLSKTDFNSKDWKEEVVRVLGIKEHMKVHFPEYNENFLLIQYGSSTIPDSSLPNDYDFIVLMLGYPENEARYIHNKGTLNDISDESNKDQLDIVYRDYLSFLFAASAGMPYENSVITDGKLISGHEGYFQWLKNITKNILIDRDFLISRFKDKIAIEKQEFQKCLNEHEKFEHDKYYVIRSGYYYITSLLQLNRIKNSDKIIFQDEMVCLSKVRNLYNDFNDDAIKIKYENLVEKLKRNSDSDIEIDDIKMILQSIKD